MDQVQRPLFRQLLGDAFATLPPSVRTVHAGDRVATFSGTAIARRGRGLFARLLAALAGLPKPGIQAVRVEIAPERGGEKWTRTFGSRTFATRLVKRGAGVFSESLPPVRFTFELSARPDGVEWRLIGSHLGPVGLPSISHPRMRAIAEDHAGRYRFRVVAVHPWFGLLFAYRGTLAPAGDA